MKTLPLEFKDGTGGYSAAPLNYKQVKREGQYAIYQRFYADGRPKDFEVIHIKVLPKGHRIFQKVLDDDEEMYPSTSSWGRWGWSCGTLSHATLKMTAVMKGKIDVVIDPDADTAESEPVEDALAGIEVTGDTYFTIAQFGEKHSLSYVDARLKVLELIEKNQAKLVGEKRLHAKGKPSKVYSLMAS
jgi:hypothetical protein